MLEEISKLFSCTRGKYIYIFRFNRILKYYEMDRLDVVHTKLIIPTAKTLFLPDLGTERLRYHCYLYSELVWIWGTNSS